ncbi:MAG: hypothetical protein V3U93_05450 [Alphaproteobacteria bacterium]
MSILCLKVLAAFGFRVRADRGAEKFEELPAHSRARNLAGGALSAGRVVGDQSR